MKSFGAFCSAVGFRREDLRDIASRKNAMYREFTSKKRGKLRQITEPLAPLKEIQRRIYRKVLRDVALPEAIVGGRPGHSVRDNAQRHVAARVLFCTDLRGFFPSITEKQVVEALIRDAGFGRGVATLIGSLCTRHGHLPQGTSTSTMLANIVMIRPISRVEKMAQEHGAVVSIWVDDLVISGNVTEALVNEACRIIAGANQNIHPKKSQWLRAGKNHMIVTGVNIEHEIQVPQRLLDVAVALAMEVVENSMAEIDVAADCLRLGGILSFVQSVSLKQHARLARRIHTALSRGRDGEPLLHLVGARHFLVT